MKSPLDYIALNQLEADWSPGRAVNPPEYIVGYDLALDERSVTMLLRSEGNEEPRIVAEFSRHIDPDGDLPLPYKRDGDLPASWRRR